MMSWNIGLAIRDRSRMKFGGGGGGAQDSGHRLVGMMYTSTWKYQPGYTLYRPYENGFLVASCLSWRWGSLALCAAAARFFLGTLPFPSP